MVTNSKEYNAMYFPKYMTREKKDENATRKRARYHVEKNGKVKPFDWKEVDHKRWVKAWNGESNLRVISRITNRKLGVEKAIAHRKSRLAKWWKY